MSKNTVTAEGLEKSFNWHASSFQTWIHTAEHIPNDLQALTLAAKSLGRCAMLADILAIDFGQCQLQEQVTQMTNRLDRLTD